MPPQPAYLTTIESSRNSPTSPDSSASHSRQGIDVTAPFYSPSLSASSLLSTSASPPNAAAVPYFSPRWTPWDVPDIPPSPPAMVPVSMPPAGLPSSSDSPVTGSDHASSLPQPHSPDSSASHSRQEGIDVTAPFYSPSLSASSLLSTSTSPPNAATVPYFSPHWTPWDVPDIPPSPPAMVPVSIPPAGLPSSSDSPVTGSDHASSLPRPHSPMLTLAAPIPSYPRVFVALDPGAAAEGEGSTHVTGSDKGSDTFEPSAVPKSIMATPDLLDLPPRSPSPLSVIGLAIAGPSRSSQAPDV